MRQTINQGVLLDPSQLNCRFALIRHGETDWNLAGKLQGSTDVPLNSTGLIQADNVGAELAEQMKKHDPQSWTAIYSSSLNRAVSTATIIGEHIGLEVVSVADLAERSYGTMEGHLPEDLRQAENSGEKIPGLETRESAVARSLNALTQIAQENHNGNVIVVSHGGAIGPLISQWGNLPKVPMIGNCSVQRVAVKNGIFRVGW